MCSIDATGKKLYWKKFRPSIKANSSLQPPFNLPPNSARAKRIFAISSPCIIIVTFCSGENALILSHQPSYIWREFSSDLSDITSTDYISFCNSLSIHTLEIGSIVNDLLTHTHIYIYIYIYLYLWLYSSYSSIY